MRIAAFCCAVRCSFKGSMHSMDGLGSRPLGILRWRPTSSSGLQSVDDDDVSFCVNTALRKGLGMYVSLYV